MSERKAEVLMTAAIIACSISFVFSKMGLSTMGAFNILAARFLLAFILLFALLGKKLMGRLDRCTILSGALVGFLFFLVMSCEMLALKRRTPVRFLCWRIWLSSLCRCWSRLCIVSGPRLWACCAPLSPWGVWPCWP